VGACGVVGDVKMMARAIGRRRDRRISKVSPIDGKKAGSAPASSPSSASPKDGKGRAWWLGWSKELVKRA